jgi:hypothetical protein
MYEVAAAAAAMLTQDSHVFADKVVQQQKAC